MVAAVLAVGALVAPAFAEAPLPTGYKVDEPLQLLFWEYRVSGPKVSEPGIGSALVCTYSTRPVVMVYTRAITPQVVRLIRKLDEATAAHKKERLGSYVVLVCDSRARARELKALADQEKVRHTLLALVVLSERGQKKFDDRFGARAETTIILATAHRRVKACRAFRPGELKDADVAQVLADLPRIFPVKKGARVNGRFWDQRPADALSPASGARRRQRFGFAEQ
jgi:hypothetical protein